MRAVDSEYHVLSGGPGRSAKLEVLNLLEQREVVARRQHGVDDWSLTDAGLNSFQIASGVKEDGELVFQYVPDLPTSDASPRYELVSRLDANGWCARVRKENPVNSRRRPVDAYVPGREKVAWFNETQKTLWRSYLLALMEADARQMEVQHFKPDGWYVAQLQDQRNVPKKRKAANALLDDFNCAAIDVASGGPPAALPEPHGPQIVLHG